MDYRKMIAALAIAGAMGATAEISSSVVGYQNMKFDTMGMYLTTATFVNIDGSQSIQDLYQMDASTGTGAAELRILNRSGIATTVYKWCKKNDPRAQGIIFPDGANGVWAVQSYIEDEDEGEIEIYTPITESAAVEQGRAIAIQINTPNSKSLVYKGIVTDNDVTIMNKVQGMFCIGNPFPAEIDIQDIQMDANTGTGAAEIRFLNRSGIATTVYKWCKKNDPRAQGIIFPDGANGVWAVQSYIEDEDEGEIEVYSSINTEVKIGAGEGVQLSTPVDKSVKITAPFSLL